MNGIEIKLNPGEAEDRKKRPAAALLFMMAGIFGILAFFCSIDEISFPVGAVYAVAAVVCWLTWYTYYGTKRVFLVYVTVFLAGWGTAAVLLEDIIQVQIKYVIDCVVEGSERGVMPITETAILLAALLSFFMALIEFMMKSHELLYILTMVIMLLSPLLGIRAGVGAMLLLFLFQTAFGIIQTTMSANGKLMFGGMRKRCLSGKSSMAAGWLLLGIFLVVFPLAAMYSERFYTNVYDAEGKFRRALNQYTGRAAEPVTGGRINNGNNYPTGTAQLELVASAQPREALYLRGFEGGEYVGGDWLPASDDLLLAEIMDRKNWQDWSGTINIRYNVMYYLMNSFMQGDNPPHTISLEIRHYREAADNIYYMPYYSERTHRYYHEEGEDIWYDYGYGNTQEGYVYRYYEQSDLRIDWENVLSNMASERDWFWEMQEAYMEEIQSAYTRVPTHILPRLTELCRENPLEDLDEITAFILYTLHNNATYTLTPGWAPLNEDIVEYFLFESGRGYCEHFAVTATLMYRLYGIPARYVTGYMISPDEFENQEQGGWKAIVTDESAHAWVEIFLRNYGWTPVEVTPAPEGGVAARYPGFNPQKYDQVVDGHDWHQEEADSRERSGIPWQIGDGQSTAEGDGTSIAFEIDFEKVGKWFYVLGTGVVYSLCLTPALLDYRRLRKLKRLETAGCRKVFTRLLEMLHFGGFAEKYDGTEEDFAEQLEQELALPRKDVAKLQEIVSQAAYGVRKPEPREEDYVRRMYADLAKTVYGTLKWHRKLIFRYCKAFY